MKPEVEAWFDDQARWGQAEIEELREELVKAKRRQKVTVSVVLPAKNEEATVGAIVQAINVRCGALVDEVVVLDSDSEDRTAAVARKAEAEVFAARDILPEYDRYRGKGEAMWKSLFVTGGDLIAYLDADLREASFGGWVVRLLEPLLREPDQIAFVKGYYKRPMLATGDAVEGGGGRVTRFGARQWVMWWPELAGFVQPLAGELAARRAALEKIRFPAGFGVDLSMLVDVRRNEDLDAMAQVNLGKKVHDHQPEDDLELMKAEIDHTMFRRLVDHGLIEGIVKPPVPELVQFRREDDGFSPRTRQVNTDERPPAIDIPEYAERPRHRRWGRR